jgi:4-amino-4-deoxy-L-arabinose transferase-like glycosyltransferase
VKWLRALSVALAAGVLLAWLAEILARPLGAGLPASLDRLLIVACTVSWLAWGAVALFRSLRAGEERRLRALALAGLTALALGVEMSTLDFQLVSHARNDEGVYVAVAEKIHSGEERLPQTFNYGHFLYYAGAFSFWIHDLFPETVTGLCRSLYGYEKTSEVRQLLLRGITGLLGALTVVPVFLIGLTVAGSSAALLGGLLIAISPVYLEVASFSISDGPSGFFATLCMLFIARLATRESTADYLFAGVAAGLAAGSKYPGGVVAVGILGVWLYWRLRQRRWSWHLLTAAGASIATMLAVMPGLVLRRQSVFTGQGLDIGFGFRQYAYGGWIGVVPESTLGWYGRELVANFGWAALIVGSTGWLLARGDVRRRLLVVAPFPALYLALICSMRMVVQRNLQPLLPSLAALLGIGIACWIAWLATRRRREARWAALPLAALALLSPVLEIGTWTVRRNRPSTFEVAVAWIEQNLPEGAGFLREDYTPDPPYRRFPSQHRRFAPRFDRAEMADPAWDYLLLSPNAYLRFMDPKQWREEHQEAFHQRYLEMFDLPLVEEFSPGRFRAGPQVRLFQLDPPEVLYRTGGRFAADDAVWLSDPTIAQRGGDGELLHTRKWQFSVYKGYFAAGSYRAETDLVPERPEGWLYVVSRDNREVGGFSTREEIAFDLPHDGKYLFKVFLEPGARFRAFEVQRLEPSAKPEGSSGAGALADQGAHRQARIAYPHTDFPHLAPG